MFENIDAIWLAQLAACAFFACVFIQSSLDKVFDRKGNLAWMEPFFEKSPFKGKVPFFLAVLTLLEMASGLGCAAGFLSILFKGPTWVPVVAMGIVCFNFVSLVLGQRLAKDYAGAAATAGYFAGALVGLWLMSAPR